MEFKIGKLYRYPKWCFLIFPARGKAGIAWAGAMTKIRPTPHMSSYWINQWSEKLKCKINCAKDNEIFMVVEQDGEYVHALFGETQGWIVCDDWTRIERVL